MLSATSTQSPLAAGSSVFTIPTVSMPTVSMASSSNLGGLPDHLFMSVPSVSENSATHSVNEVKPEQSMFPSYSIYDVYHVSESLLILSSYLNKESAGIPKCCNTKKLKFFPIICLLSITYALAC